MSRCSLCPRFRPAVPSAGPRPAPILLLGEAPARFEDERGEPFTGPTGRELDETYLPIANIPRDSIHIANARQCSERNYRNPTREQARSCAEFNLGPLLSSVQPKIIVPMGAISCSLFPHLRMNMDHGIPIPGSWGGWNGILFSMFHPTAGMRKTAYMIPLMADFKALGDLLRQLEAGTFAWPTDPYPNPDYRVCRRPEDVAAYLREAEEGVPYLAADTESLPYGSPFCLTFSHTPGTGRLIYVEDRDSLNEFIGLHTCYGLARPNEYCHLLFHNYLHDADVFDALSIPIGKFTDTMVRAYNLCLGGGGDEEEGEAHAARGSLSLKILAYRHLHMRMRSFQDTVFPHSLSYLLSWLREAAALSTPVPVVPTCECGCPRNVHGPRGKSARYANSGACLTCSCPRYRDAKQPTDTEGNRLHRKIRKLIEDSESNALLLTDDAELERNPDLNPWKRVSGWHEHELQFLEGAIGPCPVPSIEHVPERDLLTYACRDSDATLRLWLFMRRHRPWLFY